MKSRALLTGLLFLLPSLANADETVKVTFAEHIAPIVHAKCTMCHRKGQSGPFELLTYEDVREQAAGCARRGSVRTRRTDPRLLSACQSVLASSVMMPPNSTQRAPSNFIILNCLLIR